MISFLCELLNFLPGSSGLVAGIFRRSVFPVGGCMNALIVSPWWNRYALGRAISVRVLLSLNYGTCRILRLLRLRGFTTARPFASASPKVKKAKLLLV